MCTQSETAVTTTSMTAARPSTSWPASTWNGPTWNHSTDLTNRPPPCCTNCHSTPSESTNAVPTARIPYTAPLPGVRLPMNNVSTAETTGKRTMSHAFSTNQLAAAGAADSCPITPPLPLEEVHLVDVDRLPVPVDQDHDREADAHLRG